VAGELQELAILLRLVQSTSVELRGLLDAVRAHVECRA
jgi:hypothetical protein